MSRHPIQSVLLPPLVTGFLLLFGTVLFSLHEYQQTQMRDHVGHVRRVAQGILKAEMEGMARLLEVRLDRLVNEEGLEEAMRQGDRETLLRLVAPHFAALRDDGHLNQLTLLRPNGTVLLRMHALEQWGDVPERWVIQQARRSQSFAHEMEMGQQGGPLLRGVWPWRGGDGRLIGYVEGVRGEEEIIHHLAANLEVEAWYFVAKADVDRNAWQERLERPEPGVVAGWDQFQHFVLVGGSGAVPPSPALAALLDRILELREGVSAPHTCDGRECALAILPLRNSLGEESARLVLVGDLTLLVKKLRRTIWVVGIASLLLGGGLLLLYHVLLRRVEARLQLSAEKINTYVTDLETVNIELKRKQRQLQTVSEGRQRAKEQLQEAYDQMEDRVEDRTRELSEANLQLHQEIQRHRSTVELLRKSERRFGTLAAMAPVGIFQTDVKGSIRYANDRFYRICGLSPDLVLERPWVRVLRRKDRAVLRSEWQRSCRDGVAFQFEYRFSHGNGETVWALCQTVVEREGDGQIVGTVGTLTDITERKQTEMERAMLAAAIQQAAEVVYITDPVGTLQYVNPAFEHVTGYASQEVLGRPATLLKSGKHDAAFFAEMWATIRSGEVWHGRLINRRKDGTLFETETNLSPIQEYGGEISHFVAVARDVTNEVMLERQLRQSQKLEAIGTLAGGIAHDFNNLLTPVLGFTELALEELPGDSVIHRNLQMVYQAGMRAKELVNQILTFNRSTDHSPKPLRLELVVKEAVRLLRATLPTTLRMETYWDPHCGVVFADPTQMHQVVMNLCTNAAHSMRQRGGVLTVRLDRWEAPSDEKVLAEPGVSSAWVMLTVRDTGIGMTAEVLERIFDPFFTTKEAGEGTGLGLSVVHGIVRSCGGHIEVESQPGEGSEFRVYLPALEEQHEDASGPDHVPAAGEGVVLLVDDEPLVLELGKQLLEKLGYQVLTATDAEEAWELLQLDPWRIDLLLTDHTMPHMTGGELAARAMELRSDLPVILCTGYTDRLTEEQAQAMGIRHYLLKPLHHETLARAVAAALQGEGNGRGTGAERGLSAD